MAFNTPPDVFLNKALRAAAGFGDAVNSVTDFLPDSVVNPILSSLSSNPVAQAAIAAKALINNPFTNNPVANTVLGAITPKATPVGSAKRGDNNEILLYSGDEHGWVPTILYNDLNGGLPSRMNGNFNPDLHKSLPPGSVARPVPSADPAKPATTTNPPGSNNPGFDPAVQNNIKFNPTGGSNITKETNDTWLNLQQILGQQRDDTKQARKENFDRWLAASSATRAQSADLTERKTERERTLALIEKDKAIGVANIEARRVMNQALMAAMVLNQTPNPNTLNAFSLGQKVGMSAFG